MDVTTSSLGNKTVDFQECFLSSIMMRGREALDNVRDIRSLVKRLTIFEDLTSPTLTGELELQDDINLSSIVPLLGIETISIKFKVPNIQNLGTPRTYQLTFRVYKQSDRKPLNHASETYTLGLVSPELLGSLEKRISKTYRGVKMEDIIRDILTSSDYLNSPKDKFFEPTTTPVTITIPYMTLLDAINLFTLQGVTSENRSSYFFYETLNGFRFESLSGIIQRSRTTPTPPVVQRRMRGTTNTRDSKESISMEDIEMIRGFDFLEQMTNGYFASATIGVDVLSGKYRITTNTLESNGFNVKPRLNAKPFYPPQFSRLANPTSKLFVVPTRSISAEDAELRAKDPTISDNYFEQTLDARVREITELQTCVVRVKVPGAPDINVGNVVYIDIPYGSSMNRSGVVPKDFRSGRYLIVSAKHSLINNGHGLFFYETIFEACTDSYV